MSVPILLERAAEQSLPNIVKTVEAHMWDKDNVLMELLKRRDTINRTQNKTEFLFK